MAIARARSLSRAAALGAVDATTLGRRLRRLEAALGQTLFEQTREGQVLTDAGEKLLVHAEAMQSAADRIDERSARSGGLSGLLRISVSEGFGTWFVAHRLHEFVARHPEITIDLVANSGFLSPSKREADIAVLLARPNAGPVMSRKLSDYTLRPYAARSYLMAHAPPETVKDLRKHCLIGYIPDLLYAPELRYLDEIDGDLAPHVRSSSINAQHHLVAAGTGIGILPRFIGDADASLVPVLPVIGITRTFWIVTHKDTHQLARVKAFQKWLVELAASHRKTLVGD